MTTVNNCKDSLKPDHKWLVNTRREFHKIPETSFLEVKTAALIIKKLEDMGLNNYKRIGKTGVFVDIGTGQAPVLAIRADIDALPITEKETRENKEYISGHKDLMHACGHDAHITCALGTIKTLLSDPKTLSNIKGTLRIFFQPAEETGRGALQMIEGGVLNNPPVEKLVALHVDPSLNTGQIGLRKGVAFAACDEIYIEVQGCDGHGSQPHAVQDPIVATAFLITQMQTIISRNINPLKSGVVSIGKVEAGTRFNIIPEKAFIEGTVRSLDSETRNTLEQRITDMCSTLPKTFNLKGCELNYIRDTPVGVNSPSFSSDVESIIKNTFGNDNLIEPDASMGAEDFAFYTRELDGKMRANAPESCFVRLGVTKTPENEDNIKREISGLHNASFNIDENALDIGVRFFLNVVREYLF